MSNQNQYKNRVLSPSHYFHGWILVIFIVISRPIFAQTLPVSADSMFLLAQEYAKHGAYDKSLEEHLKVIRIYDLAEDHYNLCKSYNSVGLVYDKLGKYSASREFYDKALIELEFVPDKMMLSYVLNNIGMSMENQEKLDSAAIYYYHSLEIKTEIKDSTGISRTLNNIGGLRLQEGKFAEALENYLTSLEIKKELNDTIGLARAYSNIANVYGWLNILDSTEYYLFEGMKFTRQQSDQTIYSLYYQNFSALYSSNGNFELAYYYLDSNRMLQDGIFHEELASELANHQIIYDTEKKDAEIQKQRLKNKFLNEQQYRDRKEKGMYIALSVVLSFVLILLFFILKNRSQRIKRQEVLRDKENKLNQISTQRAKEQEVFLMKEIELKSNELLSTSTLTLQKQEIIVQLRQQLDNLKKENNDIPLELVKALDATFKQNINLDQEWKRFKVHFDKVHTSFFDSLLTLFPNLTESDLRHCAYIKIGLTTKEIATLFNISPSSVQKSRVRLKKKLNLSKEDDLYDFIKNQMS